MKVSLFVKNSLYTNFFKVKQIIIQSKNIDPREFELKRVNSRNFCPLATKLYISQHMRLL